MNAKMIKKKDLCGSKVLLRLAKSKVQMLQRKISRSTLNNSILMDLATLPKEKCGELRTLRKSITLDKNSIGSGMQQ